MQDLNDRYVLGNEARSNYERILQECRRLEIDVAPFDVAEPTFGMQVQMLRAIRELEDSRRVHLR